jgi:hypothetical protein
MRLNIQIYSLIFSFIFGTFFYFVLDFFSKIVKKYRLWLKIIISLLFTFVISIVYFLGLLYINNGYLHIYFLLSILVGYMFVYWLKVFWFTHKKENSKM